jgi:hypothetical protein
MSLGGLAASGYTRNMIQRFSGAYASDVAMAMSIMVAIQLVGLVAVLQLIQNFN